MFLRHLEKKTEAECEEEEEREEMGKQQKAKNLAIYI